MNGLSSRLIPLDWGVFLGFFFFAIALIRFLGRRDEATRSRSGNGPGSIDLPWPAVSASLAAKEIGGIALVAVPATVVALRGDFAYLQWVLGAVLARILLVGFVVGAFYRGGSRGPLELLENRSGPGTRRLAIAIGLIGGLLVHSVRLLAVAMLLSVVTPLSHEWSLVAAGLVAIVWTLLGGRGEAVWIDLVLVVITLAAALGVTLWIVAGLEGGWSTLLDTLRQAETFEGERFDKLRVFEGRPDPALEFTFWVALLAVPFHQIQILGIDPLASRHLARCRGPREARLALLWSSLGPILIVILLTVGAALHVFYQTCPPTDPMILRPLAWSGGAPGKVDLTLPVWIVTELPNGWRGLVLAAVFASLLTSLDSILSGIGRATGELFGRKAAETGKKPPPLPVVFAGFALGAVAFLVAHIVAETRTPLLSFAFGLTSYTTGPLLAILIVSLLGRGRFAGLALGTVVSIGLVLFVRTDLWVFFMNDALAEWLARLPAYLLVEGPEKSVKAALASEWMWPLTTGLTLVFGWDYWRENSSENKNI